MFFIHLYKIFHNSHTVYESMFFFLREMLHDKRFYNFIMLHLRTCLNFPIKNLIRVKFRQALTVLFSRKSSIMESIFWAAEYHRLILFCISIKKEYSLFEEIWSFCNRALIFFSNS